MSHDFFALLVGIDNYSPLSRVPPLRGCVADAAGVQQVMLRRWGIPAAQVRLLADHEATRAGVLAAWQDHLLANAAPDRHLWFHYSGHGSQAPSIDPDEADGMDETMVLYDSRTRGSSDLLDKEMAYLILQAEMAGAQVTVVLDCCHSGSGTRSGDQPAVRRCAARNDPVTSATLATALASDEDLLAAATAPTSHILLSGAGDHQLANEIRVPETGGWQGAMSYFLTARLRQMTPESTWASLHYPMSAEVQACYPDQLPRLEGDGGRLVLGRDLQPVEPLLRVIDGDTSGQIVVDGGAALGLSAGAALALFPATGAAVVATATVDRVVSVYASALVQPPAAVEIGWVARITSYGGATATYGVAVDDEPLTKALATVREGQPSPLLVVAGAGEPVAFRLSRHKMRYRIEDPAGMPLLLPDAPADAAGAAGLVARLEHVALYRNILGLRNRSAAPLLRALVRLEQFKLDGVEVDPAQVVARPGQTFEFRLLNSGFRPLFVAVFRLDAGYAVKRIVPARSIVETVAPGGAARLRVTDKLVRRGGAEWQQGSEAQPERVVYKVMVLTEPASLDMLELPPLGEPLPAVSAASRSDWALADLLDLGWRSGVRLHRRSDSAQEERWYVAEVGVRIGE